MQYIQSDGVFGKVPLVGMVCSDQLRSAKTFLICSALLKICSARQWCTFLPFCGVSFSFPEAAGVLASQFAARSASSCRISELLLLRLGNANPSTNPPMGPNPRTEAPKPGRSGSLFVAKEAWWEDMAGASVCRRRWLRSERTGLE